MSSKRVVVLSAVAALTVVPGVAGADVVATSATVPACVSQPVNGAAVHVVGHGAGGARIDCFYTAAGRGGVTASTPNKWEMVNETTGVVVATWQDGPVQSTEALVCPGDKVRVTMFDELQPAFSGAGDRGTYGAIRAGGAGSSSSCDGP